MLHFSFAVHEAYDVLQGCPAWKGQPIVQVLHWHLGMALPVSHADELSDLSSCTATQLFLLIFLSAQHSRKVYCFNYV